MGYYTTFEGRLHVKPRFSESEVETLETYVETTFYGDVDVDETGITFERLHGKYYDFEDDIKSIVADLVSAGYEVSGSVVATGEESADIWRLVVTPGSTVVKEKARLVWPDGSEYRA